MMRLFPRWALPGFRSRLLGGRPGGFPSLPDRRSARESALKRTPRVSWTAAVRSNRLPGHLAYASDSFGLFGISKPSTGPSSSLPNGLSAVVGSPRSRDVVGEVKGATECHVAKIAA